MTPTVALVTGASSGIGHATALLLHRMGHVVYATARRADRLAGLRALGIRTLAVDVTDEQQSAAAVATVVAECGHIDVLVNNAGYGSYGALEDVDLAEGRRQFDVNVFGLARLTQLVLPHMRARGRGRIINVSSIGGRIYEPLGAWYHATKFAVEGLSNALRLELAPFGVDVVVVQPGAVKTEWADTAIDTLVRASGHTAYADQAARLTAVLRATAAHPRRAAPPAAIAATIAQAATARRPRARYVAPRAARVATVLARLLPDRLLDRTLTLGFTLAARL